MSNLPSSHGTCENYKIDICCNPSYLMTTRLLRAGNFSADVYYNRNISKTGTFLWRLPNKTDHGFGVGSRGLEPAPNKSRSNKGSTSSCPMLSSVGNQTLST